MVKNRPKKKMHVRKATVDAVAKAWGSANMFKGYWAYIMCNKDGEFDWDKSYVYDANELVERDNVHIIGEVIR